MFPEKHRSNHGPVRDVGYEVRRGRGNAGFSCHPRSFSAAVLDDSVSAELSVERWPLEIFYGKEAITYILKTCAHLLGLDKLVRPPHCSLGSPGVSC